MAIFRTKHNRFVNDNNQEVTQEVVTAYLESNGTIEETDFNFPEDILKDNLPDEVALWKLRAVLKSLGLETQIEEAFELLEEPNRTGAIYIWNYGTAIERYSQTVLFLQSVLEMTDEQVNNIFITANSIVL